MDKFISLASGQQIGISLAFEDALYTRWLLSGTKIPFVSHFVRFHPQSVLRMWVGADQEALDLDFEFQSPRRDIPGRAYVRRPGFFLSRLTRVLRDMLGSCVVMNGNNIGYWGNQFLIVNEKLVYKKTACLFYDPLDTLAGQYAFIVQLLDGTFVARWIDMEDSPESTQRIAIRPRNTDQVHGVRAGISGYPLIRSGTIVWKDHVSQAWDPKLLYHIGDPSVLTSQVISGRLVVAHETGQPLQRHGLTFLALDACGNLYAYVVAEQEGFSRGINVDEASQILTQLGMRDAIVLGGKGDAQLVGGQEGVLIRPLMSAHDLDSARPIDYLDVDPSRLVGQEREDKLLERPVPSFVAFGLANQLR